MFGSARQEVAGVVEYNQLVFDGTDVAEVEPLVEARDRDFPGCEAVRSYAEDGESRTVPVD